MKRTVGIFTAVILGTCVAASRPAIAITAELAKKCRALALKEHPTVRAGKKAGSAKDQQEYFKSCVAKNGNVD